MPNNWFTRATLNAAMADAPAVMQASGWTSDPKEGVTQGDLNSEGARALAKSLAVLGTGVTAGISLGTLLNAPALMRTIDVIGSIDGVRNLISGNGIKKTVNLAKEGRYERAAISGLGDAFDLLGAWDLTRMGLKLGNKAYRTAHAFSTIPPIGYRNQIQRGKNWIKSMILEKPINIENPSWYDKTFKNELSFFNPSNNRYAAGELAAQVRFDAWRLHNGLPQKYNSYIEIEPGKYSYNLDKIKELTPDVPADLFRRYDTYENTIDTFTGAAGNLEMDNLYNFGKNTKNPKISYELREIEDTFDLHPFQEYDSNDVAEKINELLPLHRIQDKVQDMRKILWDKKIFGFKSEGLLPKLTSPINRAANKFRYWNPITGNTKWVKKITPKINRLEVGQLTGGKPFVMHTEIPHTIDFTVKPEGTVSWGFQGEGLPKPVQDYLSGVPLKNIQKEHNLEALDYAHIKDLQ